MKRFFVLFFLLSVLSCKQESANKAIPNTASNVEVPPVIPTELLINIYENCSNIDFIFATLPFSISQEDKPSIQNTIRFIHQAQPAQIDNSCPYFAQQIFQIDGEIVLDAKIFFQQNCTYYLFYEEGQLKYSASFNEAGINFYNNLISQAKNSSNNG